MKRKPTPELQPTKSRIFGTLFFISMYFALSSVSVYELNTLCAQLASNALKIRLEIAYIISIATPVYLAFMNSFKLPVLKWTLEFAPSVIIIILFLSNEPSFVSKSCGINLFAILICDVISSIMLYLFEKLLPEKYKW